MAGHRARIVGALDRTSQVQVGDIAAVQLGEQARAGAGHVQVRDRVAQAVERALERHADILAIDRRAGVDVAAQGEVAVDVAAVIGPHPDQVGVAVDQQVGHDQRAVGVGFVEGPDRRVVAVVRCVGVEVVSAALEDAVEHDFAHAGPGVVGA